MAKATGFLEIDREETKSILPEDRIKNFKEFILPSSNKKVSTLKEEALKTGLINEKDYDKLVNPKLMC